MKKYALITTILLLCGCQTTLVVPQGYEYKEINTGTFRLASWQKMTDFSSPVKFYIEGDGHAFTSSGRVSSDPTPRGTTVREMAFGDSFPNVVYLARPCQFIKTANCNNKYWSTARFAPEVINSSAEAIRQVAGNRPVILIGYSGGAQVASLVAVLNPDIRTKKVITVAGNLDHKRWMEYHRLPQLTGSLSLADYRDAYLRIPQLHYAGEKDDILPPLLAREFIKNNDLVVEVKGASHGSGWNKIYPLVWAEK